MIKLIILDIDGVMTDGKKTYDTEGKVSSKKYNDKDFSAIKLFKLKNIEVCFLSGDLKVNEKMAMKRKIDFWYSRGADGTINKNEFIKKFEETYNVKPAEMMYVGDDYYDLSIIHELEHTACPSDAPAYVRSEVSLVLTREGGNGVVAELYEELIGTV